MAQPTRLVIPRINIYFVHFFADEGQNFYERGVLNLRERWRKVIADIMTCKPQDR